MMSEEPRVTSENVKRMMPEGGNNDDVRGTARRAADGLGRRQLAEHGLGLDAPACSMARPSGPPARSRRPRRAPADHHAFSAALMHLPPSMLPPTTRVFLKRAAIMRLFLSVCGARSQALASPQSNQQPAQRAMALLVTAADRSRCCSSSEAPCSRARRRRQCQRQRRRPRCGATATTTRARARRAKRARRTRRPRKRRRTMRPNSRARKAEWCFEKNRATMRRAARRCCEGAAARRPAMVWLMQSGR